MLPHSERGRASEDLLLLEELRDLYDVQNEGADLEAPTSRPSLWIPCKGVSWTQVPAFPCLLQ